MLVYQNVHIHTHTEREMEINQIREGERGINKTLSSGNDTKKISNAILVYWCFIEL